MKKKVKSFEHYLRKKYNSQNTAKIKGNKPIGKFALFCYNNLILAESNEKAIVELIKLREEDLMK